MRDRLSGLQRDVLSLYRKLIRVAKKKAPSTHSYVKEKFREDALALKKNDFRLIEHAIRHGEKQLKLLKMPGVTGAHHGIATKNA